MAKQWRGDTQFSFFAGSSGVTRWGPDMPAGSTLLRMLINWSIQGTQVEIDDVTASTYPGVTLAIGYDSASDHTGQVFNFQNHSDFDWLYVETLFPQVSPTWNGVGVDVWLYAATQGVVSVEGQRKIEDPVHHMFWTAIQTFPPDIHQEWFPYLQIQGRMLYEVP